MRYFFDTEFNQNVDPIQLISLGIVAEDGRELYVINKDFDEFICDEWLWKNVLREDILKHHSCPQPAIVPWQDIKDLVSNFMMGDDQAELWAYFADYDYYLLSRLWGSFMNMPKRIPQFAMDIVQYSKQLKVSPSSYPPKLKPEHNALIDARWVKLAWQFLREIEHRQEKEDSKYWSCTECNKPINGPDVAENCKCGDEARLRDFKYIKEDPVANAIAQWWASDQAKKLLPGTASSSCKLADYLRKCGFVATPTKQSNTPRFKVGDKVRWESQAAGSSKVKVGTVEMVVPPGASPRDAPWNLTESGSPRKEESYIVSVPYQGRFTKRYWPVVSKLKLAEE